MSSQQIIEKLGTFAHRTDMERVDEAVHALQQFGEEAVHSLADALSDDDEYVRLIALEVLGEWDGDTTAALPAMISALDDPDRIVRIAAVGPVGQHAEKAEDAVPLLMKWLDTDDEHSRLTAAAVILKIDPNRHDEMMPILRGGMNNDDSAIRCLTAWLLSGLRDVAPEVIPLLQQMLDDKDEFVQEVAEEELGSLT